MDRVRGARGRGRAAAALAVLALGMTGCVERRYTIRTIPENALVIVNGEEIGPSPASKSFFYYGDRDVVISAPGYETLHVVQPINAPFWDAAITEFISENLVPVTLRDEREFVYKLKPATVATDGDLINRASNLRTLGQQPIKPHRGGILGFFGF